VNAVNLLPAGRRGPRGFGSAKGAAAGLVAVAAVGAMGWWGWSLRAEKADLGEQLTALQAQEADLTTRLGAFADVQAQAERAAAERQLVVGLTLARVNWERVVRNVATVMPRQVWLTKLKGATPNLGVTAATPGQAPTEVPVGLHVEGFAYTHRQVALAMVRVASVPGLGEPRLARAQRQTIDGRTVVRFEIDAALDARGRDRQSVVAADGASASIPTGVTP
jgi:Tfp pilus assembly protein PilN